MLLLPRYFLRIFLPVFALAACIFTGVLLMNHFIRLFNMAVMKGVPALWILNCFLRLLPSLLSLAVPMAFLVALLIALGQLSENGEILALRASGFSFFELGRPFLFLSIGLSALLLYVNHKAGPDGLHSFRNRYTAAAQKIGRIDLEAGSFLKLGAWKLFASKTDPTGGRLEGAYLVRAAAEGPLRIEAPRGSLRLEKKSGLILELEDGSLHVPDLDPQKFTAARFERYRLQVPLAQAGLANRKPDIPELSSSRLLDKLREPDISPSHRNEYQVEVALRSAMALSPFVFFWLGAPLGLRSARHTRWSGFSLSLGLLFAYYGLQALGVGLGRRTPELSFAAPWLADVLGLAAGVVLARKVSRE